MVSIGGKGGVSFTTSIAELAHREKSHSQSLSQSPSLYDAPGNQIACASKLLVTMLGKKRVLRKNLSDMAMMNVQRKRRQENMKTSAVYLIVSQPLPKSSPLNCLHSLGLNEAQSISSSAAVPFLVLLSEITSHSTLTSRDVMSTTWLQ